MDIEHPELEHEFDLSELERRLAAWRPAAGALDRDRMLYEAGRAAARADGRVQSWRLATAALVLLAVGLGGLLVHERSQRHAHWKRRLPSPPGPDHRNRAHGSPSPLGRPRRSSPSRRPATSP